MAAWAAGSRFLLGRISFFAECSSLCTSAVIVRKPVAVNQKRWSRSRGGYPVPPHPDRIVAKNKVNPAWDRQNLTSENKNFLQDLVQEEYAQVQDSPLKQAPWVRNEYQMSTRRTGLIGIKLGVIPQWDKNGKKFFTTLVQVLDNHVIKYVPPEIFEKTLTYRKRWKDEYRGYASLVVGTLSCEPFKFTRGYISQHKEAGVPPKRKLLRFPITPDAKIQPGTPLTVSHFRVGDYVDTLSKTIGHGFQGVVKRWGFAGGPRSHGPTKFQRRPGSTGGGRIWRINYQYNVLYLHGQGIPGPTHCYIKVYDSRLHKHIEQRMENVPPMPTWYPEDREGPLPEEELHPDLFQMDSSSIIFKETEAELKAKAKAKK